MRRRHQLRYVELELGAATLDECGALLYCAGVRWCLRRWFEFDWLTAPPPFVAHQRSTGVVWERRAATRAAATHYCAPRGWPWRACKWGFGRAVTQRARRRGWHRPSAGIDAFAAVVDVHAPYHVPCAHRHARLTRDGLWPQHFARALATRLAATARRARSRGERKPQQHRWQRERVATRSKHAGYCVCVGSQCQLHTVHVEHAGKRVCTTHELQAGLCFRR